MITPLFENIQNELLNKIEQSEKSLKIAVTWFTNRKLFNAILQKLTNQDFEVELIVQNDRINFIAVHKKAQQSEKKACARRKKLTI